jgi:[NiFe] hydrogenase assembly HybE family chaperone
MNPAVQSRVQTLQQAFTHIALTRMAGVPLLHPRLAVQAVGFEPEPGDTGLALGVLITPWFMNLMRLPFTAEAAQALPAPGEHAAITLAGHSLEFIGAHEDRVGRYALCSLFSPMAEFADQAAAVATAREVLALLRPTAPLTPVVEIPAAQAAVVASPAPAVRDTAPPARRGFLLGRSSARAA